MFNQIDLRELSKITAPDRAFLSLYLSGKSSFAALDKRITETKKLLNDHPDEEEYFEENLKLATNFLEKNPINSGGLVIFVCWALDYLKAFEIDVPIPDILSVNSFPYILPIAHLQDEYEDFAVVAADNKAARIFLVASSKVQDGEKIVGNIKNHVKKGGWSQQRYERRRDKQLQQYAIEIVRELDDLDKENEFRRILLVGSKETLAQIKQELPPHLEKQLVAEKTMHLAKGSSYIEQELFDLIFQEERRSEIKLWDRIREEHLKGGLTVVGADAVLAMAKAGRIETMIVNRDVQLSGTSCRDCENLASGSLDTCPACGSASLFQVDLVNEFLAILKLTSANADFVDSIQELANVGDIAALLRY